MGVPAEKFNNSSGANKRKDFSNIPVLEERDGRFVAVIGDRELPAELTDYIGCDGPTIVQGDDGIEKVLFPTEF